MIQIVPMDKTWFCDNPECDDDPNHLVEIVIGKKSYAICQVCGVIMSELTVDENYIPDPNWESYLDEIE